MHACRTNQLPCHSRSFLRSGKYPSRLCLWQFPPRLVLLKLSTHQPHLQLKLLGPPRLEEATIQPHPIAESLHGVVRQHTIACTAHQLAPCWTGLDLRRSTLQRSGQRALPLGPVLQLSRALHCLHVACYNVQQAPVLCVSRRRRALCGQQQIWTLRGWQFCEPGLSRDLRGVKCSIANPLVVFKATLNSGLPPCSIGTRMLHSNVCRRR